MLRSGGDGLPPEGDLLRLLIEVLRVSFRMQSHETIHETLVLGKRGNESAEI